MATTLHTLIVWVAAALMLLMPTPIQARFKGFSMGNNHQTTGACKTVDDWKADFNLMKSLGQGFNSVHTYASSDCDGVVRSAEAAIATGMKILVGVWATPADHFGAEKAALLTAIQRFGTGWIAGIAVGSEDLYRNTQAGQLRINPQTLANQIYDVRGMVRQFNGGIKVGHADTWTAWVDPTNDVVTRACDMAITNGFPYWQGSSIDTATNYNVFQSSLWSTQGRVSAVKPGIEVWVGETGWPTQGSNFGAAKPYRPYLERYWKKIYCWLNSKNIHFYWYTLRDSTTGTDKVEQSFGVCYWNGQRKFNFPRC
ncbi:hypothetical protein ABW21_db0206895 [Orbilia brochopaga]|nr:hypothetical protein ABW21_db0206895 [Drechslerella brochopaga]